MNGGKFNMFLLTYPNDDGTTTTIGVNYLRHYKSGKIKGKLFSRNLYTLFGVRYGTNTIIRENLTYSELKIFKKRMEKRH